MVVSKLREDQLRAGLRAFRRGSLLATSDRLTPSLQDWDSDLNQCRDVRYDTNNCGSCGKVCPSTNGQAACYNGQCSMLKCSWGYTLVNGQCSGIDTQNDPNNCGSIGHACPTTFLNGGQATCKNGVCSTTCNSGFDFDFGLGFCRDVTTDADNWYVPLSCVPLRGRTDLAVARSGRCGQTCRLTGACVTGCKNGQCYAISCDPGYTLKNGACTKIDTTCDSTSLTFVIPAYVLTRACSRSQQLRRSRQRLQVLPARRLRRLPERQVHPDVLPGWIQARLW